MSDTYFLPTGYDDYERLQVLNELYNPASLDFVLKNGLQPGMRILEYGCGIGFLSVELAKLVGEKGTVTAIDCSSDSLQIAQKYAMSLGFNNIEFKLGKVEDLVENILDHQFDYIYARWVLIFDSHPQKLIAKLYNKLANGGRLVCEELNFEDNGSFVYPYNVWIKKYHEILLFTCCKANLNVNVASSLYSLLKESQFIDVNISTSQPVLTDARKKSMYRLGYMALAQHIVKNAWLTKEDISCAINELKAVEDDSYYIIGGFRNLLVSGRVD